MLSKDYKQHKINPINTKKLANWISVLSDTSQTASVEKLVKIDLNSAIKKNLTPT